MTSPRDIYGLPGPQKWGKSQSYVAPMTLTLDEVLVIRLRLAGKSQSEIAETLRQNESWAERRLQAARRRFGGKPLKEFLEMPELLEALREDT